MYADMGNGYCMVDEIDLFINRRKPKCIYMSENEWERFSKDKDLPDRGEKGVIYRGVPVVPVDIAYGPAVPHPYI